MLALVNNLSIWLGVLWLWLGVATDFPANACFNDCIDRMVYVCLDIRDDGPTLSLNCSRPEFAVAMTEWQSSSGFPLVISLFIQCSNGSNTTCIAVSEGNWYTVLLNTDYLFTELNEVPEDLTHKCTVFGCYQRFRTAYRYPNASCSLAGPTGVTVNSAEAFTPMDREEDSSIGFIATDITTEASESASPTTFDTETLPPGITEARRSTEAVVPATEVTAASDHGARLHMMVVLIPVAAILFSVAVITCCALMVVRRSVTKKNRRKHYDFGVQDLVTDTTDTTDTGVQWFDVALPKSWVSESILTLFNHLNKHGHDDDLHSPPEWDKHGHNDFPDPSDPPHTSEGYCGKLHMEGQTVDATRECGLDITHRSKDGQEQGGVSLDRCHQVGSVSPYCGYFTSKSISKSSTSASFDLSIDFYSSCFNSRLDMTMDLKEPSTSNYDLTDSPQSSGDVASSRSSYKEGGALCCLTQESTVELDAVPDLGDVEKSPERDSLKQSPTEYMPSEGLGNFVKASGTHLLLSLQSTKIS